MNKFLYYTGVFILTLGLLSCEALQWQLDKKPETLVNTIDCSSLLGLTTQYTYWNGFGYTNTPWVVYQNGYLGSCIRADNPNLTGLGANGGFVAFQQDFATKGFIRCWVLSAGSYIDASPDLYIDGELVGQFHYESGSNDLNNFMQVCSPLILPGSHEIKIQFNSGSPLPTLDEIQIWEFK